MLPVSGRARKIQRKAGRGRPRGLCSPGFPLMGWVQAGTWASPPRRDPPQLSISLWDQCPVFIQERARVFGASRSFGVKLWRGVHKFVLNAFALLI